VTAAKILTTPESHSKYLRVTPLTQGEHMKTLAAITIAMLTATAAVAQTAPAAPAAPAKPAAAAPAAAAPAPAAAPAKVDCKDVKNKDHADCKKK
jgi:hypothetical protein